MKMTTRALFCRLAVSGLILTACAASVTPKAGAQFGGSIEMGDKASDGTIFFAVSADGASITNLSISLYDVVCDGLTAGRVSDFSSYPNIAVRSGGFAASRPAMGGVIENFKLETPPSGWPTVESLSDAGQIEGRFSSPTEASGTIKIYLGVPFSEFACELGTFAWSAKGQ